MKGTEVNPTVTRIEPSELEHLAVLARAPEGLIVRDKPMREPTPDHLLQLDGQGQFPVVATVRRPAAPVLQKACVYRTPMLVASHLLTQVLLDIDRASVVLKGRLTADEVHQLSRLLRGSADPLLSLRALRQERSTDAPCLQKVSPRELDAVLALMRLHDAGVDLASWL